MMCLKRKKAYEAQMEKLNATRYTIEQQSMTISSATINVETLKAMKDANQSMKVIHKDM
jgi:charged multivesicular body protein 4